MIVVVVIGSLSLGSNCNRRRVSATSFLVLIVPGVLACKTNRDATPAARPAPTLAATPPPQAPEGMALVPAGTFTMGSSDPMFADANHLHAVELDAFFIDRTEVTNAAFARFVAQTGYVTIAEKKPDARDFPGVPPEKLVAGAVTFVAPTHDVSLDDHSRWWEYREGANWRAPEGKGSSIDDRANHPVVHVSFIDADAYCKASGKRLPTEAEWERAARGGLPEKRFPWGDDAKPGGRFMANVWQGHFPRENTREDGFVRTSPVATFTPNGYGLHDVSGNVWEWCADFYRPDSYAQSPRRNPTGPSESFDPNEPGVAKRVMRGGSFLCSDLYCVRYAIGSRGKGAPDTGSSHLGFRCARDAR